MSEPEKKRRGRRTKLDRASPEGRPWTNRLRAARADACMTLAQLAAASGLSPDAVESYDAGRRTPSVTAGVALARALKKTVEDLFG